MAIRHLSHLISLLALRSEIIYTLDQIQAHPLTKSYAPAHEAIRDEWSVIFNEDLTSRDGISAVNARITMYAVLLDGLASRVSKAILTLTGDNRNNALYIAYFKDKSLSDFKRPILGDQLKAMATWVKELTSSGVPTLVELGAEVDAAVKGADDAEKTRIALHAASTFSRHSGNRKKFSDKVNALRKLHYGEFSKLACENLGLPSNFADLFFRHEASTDEAPTIESVNAEIGELKKQIAEKEELIKDLKAEAEEEAKEQQEKAARLAAIADLEKIEAEAKQKAALARAKIAELSD